MAAARALPEHLGAEINTISSPSNALFEVSAFGVEETFVLVVVFGFIAYIALNFEEIVAKQKIATEKAMKEQNRNVNDAMAKQKRDIDAAMRKQAEATKNAKKNGPR